MACHKQDKKDKEHFKREEELLEEAVQPHNSPLGTAFIPVLLFTRSFISQQISQQTDRTYIVEGFYAFQQRRVYNITLIFTRGRIRLQRRPHFAMRAG